MDFHPKQTNYHYQQGVSQPGRKRWPWIVALALVVLGAIAAYVLWPRPVSAPQPAASSQAEGTEDQNQPEETPNFNNRALQATLDKWAADQTGTASVVITDTSGEVLAKHNPNDEMFAASIYKLYVAYEGYRQLDAGAVDPSEIYVGGWTRKKCLDEMIRSSHSPCAEKLWAELGKQATTDKLITYGITNTDMTALTTTADDAAKMLVRIQQGVGLSKASQQAFLTSMKQQIYRDALPSGFVGTVYDKVGFRETTEYHDVGILEFKDGRRLIVSVMTENVGTAGIRQLAEVIQQAARN